MSVCVAIAAWNAERTIGRAIASALAQPEVSEVIVVDDCSTDHTAETALAAGDGSGRLLVLRQAANAGPSAARNHALAESRAEFFAVLDADDYLLPGRFGTLLAVADWDAIADNIAFVPEAADDQRQPPAIAEFPATPRPLSLAGLLAGGLTQRGRNRAEIGFLKPVFRRQWLLDRALRYDESLRLSEDFLLYATILGQGGRFLLVPRCGYVAIERPGSLSGSHGAAELGALLAAIDAWAAATRFDPAAARAFARYRAQLSANYRHRRLLDDKRNFGLVRALCNLADDPSAIPRVAGRIAHDKLSAAFPPAPQPAAIRYLLTP